MSMDYRLSLQTSYGMVTGINILEFVASDTQIALFESKYLFQTFFFGYPRKDFTCVQAVQLYKAGVLSGVKVGKKTVFGIPDLNRIVNWWYF